MNAKDEQLGIKKCAQRELEEETGYSVPLKNINVLGHNYYSSSGIITERINIAISAATAAMVCKKNFFISKIITQHEQNAKAHLTNLHYGNNMLKYRRKHRPHGGIFICGWR